MLLGVVRASLTTTCSGASGIWPSVSVPCVVVKKVLRGPDSLGNVQDRQIKASAGSYRHTEKIAKYIGKYITKDLISEFNKKRYWQSAGISIEEAQVYWLSLCRCLRL